MADTLQRRKNYPPSRVAAEPWTDQNRNLRLFRGSTPSGYVNDLWKYNISTGNWIWFSGSSTLHESTVSAVIGTPNANSTPVARYQPAAWVGPYGSLRLFDGTNG